MTQLALKRAPRNAPAQPRVYQVGVLSVSSAFAAASYRGFAAASSEFALILLRTYKRWVSPLLPSACRFHPTCSEYTMDAIRKYGLLRGAGMGLWRLLRCHPFHHGGFDPVR